MNDSNHRMRIPPVYHIEMVRDRHKEHLDCLRDTRKIAGFLDICEDSSYTVIEVSKEAAGTIEFEPSDTQICPSSISELSLAQSSSTAQIVLAIIQIAYASYSLAKNTTGDVERNGYTAFSLTVVPYIVMSFINLLGNIATPTYPCVYLLYTSTVEEAQSRGNHIFGCVGFIRETNLDTVDSPTNPEQLCISPLDCRPQPGRALHEMGPQRSPETQHLKHVNVCFNRRCSREDRKIRTNRPRIKIGTGEPQEKLSTRYQIFEVCLLLLGCLFIIAIPIGMLYYVSKRYPVKDIAIKDRIPVISWYVVGDLTGIILVRKRKSASFVSLTGEVAIVSKTLFACCCGRSNGGRREYISGKWKRALVITLVFSIGFAASIWNFYHVATKLLEFGSCRSLVE